MVVSDLKPFMLVVVNDAGAYAHNDALSSLTAFFPPESMLLLADKNVKHTRINGGFDAFIKVTSIDLHITGYVWIGAVDTVE